jgi:hypothetical protein
VKYEKAAECLNKDRDALLTFTNSPPSSGSTYEPRTPSTARSQPCATARSGRRAAYRTIPRSPWSSNSSKPHRKVGVASIATTSCTGSRCEIHRRAGGRHQAQHKPAVGLRQKACRCAWGILATAGRALNSKNINRVLRRIPFLRSVSLFDRRGTVSSP